MALGQNISFMKGFSIFPRTSKLILKTGNEIIQKENWNLSPNSSSLIQMTFKKCFSFSLGVQNWFSKQEMEIFKQEIKFFLRSFMPLIKKILLQNSSHFCQGTSKQGMESSKQERESNIQLPAPRSKMFLLQNVLSSLTSKLIS